jgi:hypothetical protein
MMLTNYKKGNKQLYGNQQTSVEELELAPPETTQIDIMFFLI